MMQTANRPLGAVNRRRGGRIAPRGQCCTHARGGSPQEWPNAPAVCHDLRHHFVFALPHFNALRGHSTYTVASTVQTLSSHFIAPEFDAPADSLRKPRMSA
eukprot:7253518-Pyramimonas_sp.AAC.1